MDWWLALVPVAVGVGWFLCMVFVSGKREDDHRMALGRMQYEHKIQAEKANAICKSRVERAYTIGMKRGMRSVALSTFEPCVPVPASAEEREFGEALGDSIGKFVNAIASVGRILAVANERIAEVVQLGEQPVEDCDGD